MSHSCCHCTCNTSYLADRQAKVRQLQSLVADFERIKENDAVDMDDRYHLVMHDDCFGRIETLFEELGVRFHIEALSPRILGYETCINLTWTEIEYRCKSLSGLLNDQD
jgi:hypothetical protein